VKKPSEKGLTGPTSTVLADMAAFITPHLPKTEADPPLFVLGHSMGGGQVATMLCDPEYEDLIKKVRGWLLECPFIGWYETVKPSKFKEFSGRLAGKLLPHVQLLNIIPASNLCRDPDVVISIQEDKLMHNTGTLEGLAGMMDRTAALTNHVGKLSPHLKSLWQGHATDDKGVSAEESKKWYDAVTTGVPDRTFKWYQGYYHQLHADYGKEVFYKDVGDWILARAGGGMGEDAGPKQPQAAAAAAPGADGEVKAEAKL
jgi:acylglycerol lipase